MTVSLIILSALLGVGLILYLHDRYNPSTETAADGAQPDVVADTTDEECCGMHITCEKDSLLASISPEIVYYDDEELDRYCGREAGAYTEDECEEFRDVMLTLLPDDIAGWARSLQLRGIELPIDVRDELLLIVSEARAARAS